MTISPSSLAAGNFVGAQNEQFAVSASVIPQKNVIIGTFDEATFTTLAENVPIRVFSPEDVGSKTGFGFMLHRLARAAWKAGGVETWIIPQLEGGSDPDQATGTLDFTASAGVVAGTLALYVAGDRVAITTTKSETPTNIAIALAAAINADDNLPVAATISAPGVITITSKSGGTWGNGINLSFSLSEGEALPAGVAVTIAPASGYLSTGAGVPDIQDALDALGTGDGQNDKYFTNLIHGYGTDTATLDAISTYNGAGNDFIGNYKKEISRPFRSLVGDITADTAGLAAALVIGGNRKTDRTNGIICVPGSQSHAQEIAAQMIGIMAVTNSTRAEEGYIDKTLDGVWPGEIADRWTNDYDNRDQAVKGGVSTTLVKSGVVKAQNIITFYHPDDISQESNGYRPMRNISILQNLLYNYRMNFERTKWKGISIVQDTSQVSDVTDKEKARDVDSVMDDLIQLADVFAGKAWLYTADYTKSELQKGDKVVLRAGLTGFDITFPVIFSGEGGLINSVIKFDTSTAILLGGE